MEAITEKVPVTFIDGTKGEVEVKKYVNFRDKQKIISKNTSKGKLRGSEVEMEIDFFKMVPEYLETVWADTEHKIDDVASDSIEPYVMEKIKSFLQTGAE